MASERWQPGASVGGIGFEQQAKSSSPGTGLELQEVDGVGSIACGVARTGADVSARQVLVALAYLKRRYISYDDPHIEEDGAYRDLWERNAIPIVAKKGPYVVGSIRLVPRTTELRLPIELPDTDGFMMEIDPPYQELVNNASYEVSQLAKSPDPEYAADSNITVAVIRGFIAQLQQRGVDYAVAAIDARVKRLLNAPTLNLGLPAIGPTSYYVGSRSTPVLVNVADVIESSKGAKRKNLSRFLAQGQGVPGYEWYKGI